MDERRARAERLRRRDPEDEGARRRERAEVLRSRPAAFLVFINGPRLGDELRVLPGEGPLVIGRWRGADVPVADLWLARRAAVLSYEGERLWLEDLRSANGCYVNGVQVRDGCFLEEGDELRLGGTGLLVSYRGPEGPERGESRE